MVAVLGIVQSGGDIWLVLAYTPGVMSAHFLVEYRTHFTNFHQLVIAGIGATEQLCSIMGICSVSLFFAQSTDCYQWELFEVSGLKIRGTHLICAFSFLSGFYYNLENLYKGFIQAEDKIYALKCLAPYLQFFAMMIAGSYSRFYEARSMRFIIMCGLFLLYANCYLNLCTMAKKRYNWFYVDPFFYLAIIWLDVQGITTDKQTIMFYIAFFVLISVKYVLLMSAIV